MKILTDCKYFKGYVPCIRNKEYGENCDTCNSYTPTDYNILIIKLEAIGDVIRTTPILSRLSSLYPRARIYWLTSAPDILPKDKIDYILNFNFGSLEILKNIKFDLLLNLDKSLEACAITNSIQATHKKGFILNHEGVPYPANDSASHKYMSGLYDVYSKNNKAHYVQEIFEICDIGKFNDEPYILNNVEKGKNTWDIDTTKTVVGLNTGCSKRWKSRLWPEEYWINLARYLIILGYEVLLLGGKLENKKNKRISAYSNAKYFGFHSLTKYVDLIDNCDTVVSQVTLTVHIAIGLRKKVVLMNNIFNSNEFYLYGLGKIIEPSSGCNCYYLQNCKREANGKKHCMRDITVEEVLQIVEEL